MFRLNRYVSLLIVCLLAACEGDQGPVGPQGPEGPAGNLTAGEGITISSNVISTSLSSDDGNGPNSGSNLVHWNRLTGVPAGFADGTDDGAAATLTTTFVTGTTYTLAPGDRFGGSENCPSGSVAIGGGWTTGSPTARGIDVQQSFQQSPTQWVLTFVNTGTSTFSVTAYVLCLSISS